MANAPILNLHGRCLTIGPADLKATHQPIKLDGASQPAPWGRD